MGSSIFVAPTSLGAQSLSHCITREVQKRLLFISTKGPRREHCFISTFLVLIWPPLISDSVIVDFIKSCINDQSGDVNIVNLPVQIKTQKSRWEDK